MKRFSEVRIPAMAALALSVTFVLAPTVQADEYNRKTVITISNPVEIPGVVLPAGTYVMRLFNSSSNRHIVQFMNEDQTRQLALTFAASAERIRPTGKTVLTMYEGSQGAPPAVRTWYYPGDTVGQEFLYPHKQAVRISERTKVAVPEIETQKSAVITEKAETRTATEPVLVARAEPAPAPIAAPVPEPVAAPEPAPAPEPIAAPEPQQKSEAPVAEPQPPPAVPSTSTPDSLPKTAGETALAGLIGILSLGFAFGVRKLRRQGTHQ
ncbi:MAG TPA: hypothetical protein VLN48_14150 [Bryobacteraceae bacterium]|nr:hypothetical protein [Bryobacteraceae bacterium]